ncbi:MAG TPA: diguanylate cyclase [Myxococcales bacterium]|nr:diguanylate cyclase [Myxococcales bacterium]
MPAAILGLAVLLMRGAFAQFAWPGPAQVAPWALLVAAGVRAALRQARRKLSGVRAPAQWTVESCALSAVGALALAQLGGGLTSPLYPLVYLLAAGYALALPLRFALPALGWLLGLDAGLFFAEGALPARWPLLAMHAAFTAVFATLYHGVLATRLRAARTAEEEAVRRRVADAERSAREFRLIATAEADPERQLLAAVSEIEESVRGALSVAAAALQPHTVAVFLLSPDGGTVRLHDSISRGDRLFRGPLPIREGALGAVLAAGRPVLLQGDGPALSHYDGPAPAHSFCGVPLRDRHEHVLGALVADRESPFGPADEQVLTSLAGEVVRAMEGERLLAAVRGEKEEKARFFRALEELNRTTTLAQAAECAVAQAREMGGLDLCAVTLVEEPARAGARPRHRVQAVAGDGSGPLSGLTFADNAGLVANVVRLGAPLPGRELQAMERLVIFDSSTAVRGLGALKIFPLRAGESTVGAMVCGTRRRDGLPDPAQAALSMLSLQAAAALVRTRLYEEAERLATTDGLTGLLNRRTLATQLVARVREAQRYRRPLSLLLIDVDHFKKVNDTHGHPAGDAVLRGVAAVARAQARETDLVARYGGEELAVVLPETDAAGARAIAERLRAAVESTAHASDQGALRVTVSVGVATWPGGGQNGDELLTTADRALYRAKQTGRNRVESGPGKAAA